MRKAEIIEPVDQDREALTQHIVGKLIETSCKRDKLYGMESPMLNQMAEEAGVDLEEAFGDKKPSPPEAGIGIKSHEDRPRRRPRGARIRVLLRGASETKSHEDQPQHMSKALQNSHRGILACPRRPETESRPLPSGHPT